MKIRKPFNRWQLLKEQHRMLKRNKEYKWSLLTLLWKVYIIGLRYSLAHIKDGNTLFCVMLLNFLSKKVVYIKNFYLYKNEDKVENRNIPYLFSLQMATLRKDGYRIVLVSADINNKDSLNFLIKKLGFSPSRYYFLNYLITKNVKHANCFITLQRNITNIIYLDAETRILK